MARSSEAIIDEPSFLLSFYATECALKAAILRHHRVRGWDELNDELMEKYRHHDLRRLAKAINVGGKAAQDLKDCRTRAQDKTIPIHEIHSAWRYGAKLHAADQQRLVGALKQVREWLDENG